MNDAFSQCDGHVAISRFDIALQVDCAICGSTDVSVVGDEAVRETYEFAGDGRVDKGRRPATPALVVSCAGCGVTYGLHS